MGWYSSSNMVNILVYSSAVMIPSRSIDLNGAILAWNITSLSNCSRVMGHTSLETSRYITAVTAILSVTVSVCGELPPTLRAGESIDSFLTNAFRVSVPPRLPTFSGAESLGLGVLRLLYLFTAARTDYPSLGISGTCALTSHIITLTKRFYSFLGQPQCNSYCFVALTRFAQTDYAVSFFDGHDTTSFHYTDI